MIKPDDISERFWNLPQKPDEEARREQLFLDDVIHKAHVEREIESRLGGVESVLDMGAGTGRFSLWLAARGFHVTHMDISEGMIEKARSEAARSGVLENISFQQGRFADLAAYSPQQFDLVICSDAPVSYAYPDHEAAIAALVRVCKKAIVLSVSSRFSYISLCLNPLQKEPYFADPESEEPIVKFYRDMGRIHLASETPHLGAARAVLSTGLMSAPQETDHAYQAGHAPWPRNYLFMPTELDTLLQRNNVTDIRLSGPGALSRGIPNQALRTLLLNEEYRQDFLDLCYTFDSQPSICGLGKDNLVASGLCTHDI